MVSFVGASEFRVQMMIDRQKIKKLGVGSNQMEFTDFLIEEKGDKTFPDYRKLDLMKVPKLISNTWVLDYRNGIDDGLLFNFSGTKIDEHYGQNITGKKMEEVYKGIFRDEILDCFRQPFLQKKVIHAIRSDKFNDQGYIRDRKVESLLFPCSEDDQIINFGIGITKITSGDEKIEPTFSVL